VLTLVQIQRSATSSADAATLVADYLAFDRRRTSRRHYMKAFGGMAVVVLLGAAFGRVPVGESELVAGLLLLPPLVLGTSEAISWRRLVRRLDQVRTEVQTVKVVKKS
jgi:hypothetical protein